jgi:hypothetical protein
MCDLCIYYTLKGIYAYDYKLAEWSSESFGGCMSGLVYYLRLS